MRAYKIYPIAGNKRHTKFAGSDAEARAARQHLVDAAGFKKKDVDYVQVEIPTGKAELLAFLNSMVKEITAEGE